MNVWTVNALSNAMASFQFSDAMRQRMRHMTDNWRSILLFAQRLLDGYPGYLADGLLSAYFGKAYPMLESVARRHLEIGDGDVGRRNHEWLFWFLDVEDLLRCHSSVAHQVLVEAVLDDRDSSVRCPWVEQDVGDEDVDAEIERVLGVVLRIRDAKGDHVALIELAEFVEKVLFMIADDVNFHPLIIALYHL